MKKVDVAINSSLWTASGCIKPTLVFQLPVLAGIAPAGVKRKATTLALARKAVKHDWHILHDTTKHEVPPCRLKSRKPYNKEAQEMLTVIPEDRSKDACIAGNVEPGVGNIRTHPGTPSRIGPSRRRQGRRAEPKTLDDSTQTANWGRSVQSIHEEVGTVDSTACECGEPELTADKIINSCPLYYTTIRSRPLRSWSIDQSMYPTY